MLSNIIDGWFYCFYSILNDNFLLSQCIYLANIRGFELVGCTINSEEILSKGHRVYIDYKLSIV